MSVFERMPAGFSPKSGSPKSPDFTPLRIGWHLEHRFFCFEFDEGLIDLDDVTDGDQHFDDVS